MPRLGKKDYSSLVYGSVIVYTGQKDTPGNWIFQKCATEKCNNHVGYWSKTCEPLYKYKNAKCEVCS